MVPLLPTATNMPLPYVMLRIGLGILALIVQERPSSKKIVVYSNICSVAKSYFRVRGGYAG